MKAEKMLDLFWLFALLQKRSWLPSMLQKQANHCCCCCYMFYAWILAQPTWFDPLLSLCLLVLQVSPRWPGECTQASFGALCSDPGALLLASGGERRRPSFFLCISCPWSGVSHWSREVWLGSVGNVRHSQEMLGHSLLPGHSWHLALVGEQGQEGAYNRKYSRSLQRCFSFKWKVSRLLFKYFYFFSPSLQLNVLFTDDINIIPCFLL